MTISRQTDFGNAMAGKVSGARFIGGTSAGFDAGAIILRGAGFVLSSSQSDNPANEPIYVVDGAIIITSKADSSDCLPVNQHFLPSVNERGANELKLNSEGSGAALSQSEKIRPHLISTSVTNSSCLINSIF